MGVDDKTEKENFFHHFFIELEHVTVNEIGAFGIPPVFLGPGFLGSGSWF